MKNFNDDFLYRYLNKAKVPYIKKEVAHSILDHPGAPSLKAVSDTLEGLNVRTMAVGLETADLDQIDFPVIAHFKKGHGEFVLLESKKKDKVRYFQKGKLLEENLQAFEQNWSGTTLLLDPPDHISLENPKAYYWKKYGKQALGALMGLIVLVLAISGIAASSANLEIYLSSLLVLNLSGLGLSFYLYQIHLDKSLDGDKFCKKTKTVDCNAVLFSKWSKLFGVFNWAQLGIVYFFVQSMTLLLSFLSVELVEPSLGLLSFLTLLAGAFSLYSVFLQAFVIKKWCSLCVACQGIILAAIGLNFYQGLPFNAELSTTPLLMLGISGFVGLILTIEFTSGNELKATLEEKTVQLAKFKGDKDIFQDLLKRQKISPDYSQLEGLISIGHEAAPNEILMVASLHCGPCIRMFNDLTDLIKNHPDKVRLKIIFTMPRTDEIEKLPVQSRLINLAITDSEATVAEAITAWYNSIGRKDGEQIWLEQNKPKRILLGDELVVPVMTHQIWLTKAMIYKTPTLFFNNYELPQIYAGSDNLKYFLD